MQYVSMLYLGAEREQHLYRVEPLMLDGVLDRKLATFAAPWVVDIGSSSCQLAYCSVWICVVNRTEVRQM